MDLIKYQTSVELPIKLLEDLRKEAIYDDYRSRSYTSYDNYIALLNKAGYKRSDGPQSSKKVSTHLKAALEDLIGVKAEKAIIIKCDPNFIINPHTDIESSSSRKSCLTWVLFPEDPANCAPTLFYDKDYKVIKQYNYNKLGFILDTRLVHGMINNEHTRILVQLTYDLEPEELQEKIK